MANQFLTINMITNEASRVLENMLSFSKYVNRQYDDRFANSGAKIGDTLRLRKPPRYVGRSGAALSVEDSIDTSVNLTIGPNATSWYQFGEQFGVDITFTTADLTLSMDDFSSRYIKPAMARVANRIDEKGMTLAKLAVANTVGTPGVTPQTARVWLQSGAVLDRNAALRDNERYVCMSPEAQAETVDGLKGLFQQSNLIGEQYAMGAMGRGLGYLFSMDQNVQSHTVGALGGTPLVNGAQGASSTTSDPWTSTTSLVTDGWTAAATQRLNAGDVITIDGCYAVNPQSKAALPQLQQFVVTADASSDGSGNLTAVISPAIITAGPFQTVSAGAANNAPITVVGTAATAYPQNIAFHKDAFVLATADLELPRGVDMAARSNYKGISIRAVRQYAISTDTLPTRLDVFYGWCAFQPQLACRVWG